MQNHKAFSILELLVVITIIAIISVFGYPKVDKWLTDREISNEVNKFVAYFEEKKSEVNSKVEIFSEINKDGYKETFLELVYVILAAGTSAKLALSTVDILEKDDFVGRSALLNSERNSKIWGLKVDGGIAVKGQNLSIDNKNIGVISSSTWSPYLECGVCIARFDKFDLKEGKFINVNGINGEILKAEICSLPMYDKDGLILR